jgi:hypothetical protein
LTFFFFFFFNVALPYSICRGADPHSEITTSQSVGSRLSRVASVSVSLLQKCRREKPQKRWHHPILLLLSRFFTVYYSLSLSLSIISALSSFILLLCIDKEWSKVNGCGKVNGLGCLIPNPTLTSREDFGFRLHHVKWIPGLLKTVEVRFLVWGVENFEIGEACKGT